MNNQRNKYQHFVIENLCLNIDGGITIRRVRSLNAATGKLREDLQYVNIQKPRHSF
jgi:hypothetical protein